MSEGTRVMVASYYRFVSLPDYVELREWVKGLGNRWGVKGSILLAPEGINGSNAGSETSLESFFQAIGADPRFGELEKRVSFCEEMPFGKFKVRLKKEIVAMKNPLSDPSLGVGEYVAPSEWNALIQDPNVIVIDVRNRYETELGTFQGAIDPKTDHFSDFPMFIESQLVSGDKTIATFCTGGIRCEKATALLRQMGFKDVRHLKGGILSYLEETSAEESLWEGSCFVFDDREAVELGLKPVDRGPASLYAPWPRRSQTES